MTAKTYRSANGKVVDLGALKLKNEKIRAVGNMSVNARGDLVDAQNRPIQSRNQQVKKQYQSQAQTNVSESPVKTSSRINADIPPPPEDFDQGIDTDGEGLAAAIRQSRQLNQSE